MTSSFSRMTTPSKPFLIQHQTFHFNSSLQSPFSQSNPKKGHKCLVETRCPVLYIPSFTQSIATSTHLLATRIDPVLQNNQSSHAVRLVLHPSKHFPETTRTRSHAQPLIDLDFKFEKQKAKDVASQSKCKRKGNGSGWWESIGRPRDLGRS